MESVKNVTKHLGSCHCGVVKFAVELDASGATMCNCSICTKLNAVGLTVQPSAFTLRAGEESLSPYAFGGKVSTRYFCKHCGVHCFGRGDVPQLGGAFV